MGKTEKVKVVDNGAHWPFRREGEAIFPA